MTTTIKININQLSGVVDHLIKYDALETDTVYPIIKYLQDWCDESLEGEWTEEWMLPKVKKSGWFADVNRFKLYHFKDPNDAALFKLTFL